MQPVVGVLADNSKSKYGRRRPFMVGGALTVAACLIVLGWTSEMVRMFVSEPEFAKSCTITIAVLSIYAVDFAINAVQSSCRSLIVDTLPISKQQLGSAWASRMGAVGHLVGYAVGTIDLQSIFGKALGDSQFKQLCLIAAFFLLLAVGITSYATDERILVSSKDADVRSGALKTLSKIVKTTMNLPDQIQAICWVQFWAWIGMPASSHLPLSSNSPNTYRQAGSPSSSTAPPGSAKSTFATTPLPPPPPQPTPSATSAGSAPSPSLSSLSSPSQPPSSSPGSSNPPHPLNPYAPSLQQTSPPAHHRSSARWSRLSNQPSLGSRRDTRNQTY